MQEILFGQLEKEMSLKRLLDLFIINMAVEKEVKNEH